jgi:hypothetical protein
MVDRDAVVGYPGVADTLEASVGVAGGVGVRVPVDVTVAGRSVETTSTCSSMAAALRLTTTGVAVSTSAWTAGAKPFISTVTVNGPLPGPGSAK